MNIFDEKTELLKELAIEILGDDIGVRTCQSSFEQDLYLLDTENGAIEITGETLEDEICTRRAICHFRDHII